MRKALEERQFEFQDEPEEVRLSKAMFRIWSSLNKLYRDINMVAIHSPHRNLTEEQRLLINEVLLDAQQLLAKQNYCSMLSLIPQESASFANTLVVIGAHKAAVRAFRVNVLGESVRSL